MARIEQRIHFRFDPDLDWEMATLAERVPPGLRAGDDAVRQLRVSVVLQIALAVITHFYIEAKQSTQLKG